VESLGKDLEGAKAAEQLTAERALKALETAENLRKEVNAERESSAALKAQVDMLSKHLEDAKAIGLAEVDLYIGALGQFGGVASSLPPEPSAYIIFS
jgi:pyridoxine 5'-phosphate synthase PdxJ